MSAQKRKKLPPFNGVPMTMAKVDGEVSHEEALKVATNLNVCLLPKTVLSDLQKIGVKLDEDGVIQTGNTWLCVAGQAVVKFILLIANATHDVKDAERRAPVLAQLTKSLAITAGNMSDTVIERGGQSPVAHKERAFPAGKITQININPPAKPEAA